MENNGLLFDFPACVETLRASEGERDSIGLLREKILHRALKEYYISLYPEAIPEEKVGSYSADLFLPGKNTIIEIQTGSFYPLKKKIAYYLDNTDCNIIVAHPMPAVKYLFWIDERDGSVSSPRKSPKKATARDALKEIFWLGERIGDPRLSFDLILMELEEYRFLCGYSADRKRGSERYEYVPIRLLERLCLCGKDDIRALFPQLPERFCQKDISRAFRQKGRAVSHLARLAVLCGLSEEDGKEGRTIYYRRKS